MIGFPAAISLIVFGTLFGAFVVWLSMRVKLSEQSKSLRVELEAQLDQERKISEDKLKLLDDAQRTFSDAFKALCADALQSNNQSFINLAKATLEKAQETANADLDKRQTAITELIKPVRDSL